METIKEVDKRDLLRNFIADNEIPMSTLFDLYSTKKKFLLEELFSFYYGERSVTYMELRAYYEDNKNHEDFKHFEQHVLSNTYVLIYRQNKDRYRSLGWNTLKEMKDWIHNFNDTKNFEILYLIKDKEPIKIKPDTRYVRTFTIEE